MIALRPGTLLRSAMPAAFALAAAAGLCTPAEAQSVSVVRDSLRQAARDANVGKSVLGLSGFAAMPGISAANFTIDNGPGSNDSHVSRTALPIGQDFDSVSLLGASLYVEGTFGWFTSTQRFDPLLVGTRFEGSGKSRVNSYSGIGGIGLTFPVTQKLSLRPIFMLGYARVDDDTNFAGPGAVPLDRISRGILFNWDVEELLYGPALEAMFETPVSGDINFSANARVNFVFAETLDASDSALESSSDFVVFTAHGEFDGPTGLTAFNRELRWIAFGANTTFGGDAADSLGSDWFFELGGGIELVDRAAVPQIGLEGVSLRASVIFGDNITGWSVGGQLEF